MNLTTLGVMLHLIINGFLQSQKQFI